MFARSPVLWGERGTERARHGASPARPGEPQAWERREDSVARGSPRLFCHLCRSPRALPAACPCSGLRWRQGREAQHGPCSARAEGPAGQRRLRPSAPRHGGCARAEPAGPRRDRERPGRDPGEGARPLRATTETPAQLRAAGGTKAPARLWESTAQ